MIPLPKRGPLEWNLNTLLQLITLFSVLVGGVTVWVNTSRDIQDLEAWRTAHEQHHRERNAEVRSIEARYDERMKKLESDLQRLQGSVEHLNFRLSANEAATASTTEAVKNVQDAMVRQGGDIQVIKEILQRLERAMGASRPVP